MKTKGLIVLTAPAVIVVFKMKNVAETHVAASYVHVF